MIYYKLYNHCPKTMQLGYRGESFSAANELENNGNRAGSCEYYRFLFPLGDWDLQKRTNSTVNTRLVPLCRPLRTCDTHAAWVDAGWTMFKMMERSTLAACRRPLAKRPGQLLAHLVSLLVFDLKLASNVTVI